MRSIWTSAALALAVLLVLVGSCADEPAEESGPGEEGGAGGSVEPVPLGDGCEFDAAPCVDGATCGWLPCGRDRHDCAAPGSYRCVPSFATCEAAACGPADECVDSYPSSTATEPVHFCLPLPGIGGECSERCAPGLVCAAADGGSDLCQAPGAEGDPCDRYTEGVCQEGLACGGGSPSGIYDDKCRSIPGEGAACETNLFCSFGLFDATLYCHGGVCAPRGAQGETCPVDFGSCDGAGNCSYETDLHAACQGGLTCVRTTATGCFERSDCGGGQSCCGDVADPYAGSCSGADICPGPVGVCTP